MKHLLALLLALTLLWAPFVTSAATLSSVEDQEIRARIAALQAEIAVLVAQLQALRAKEITRPRVLGVVDERRSTRTIGELQQATYYKGAYVALYEVEGTTLLPVAGTTYLKVDGEIWDLFVAIAGGDFVRQKIKEFRLYNSELAEHDGFVERFSGEEKWILGINLYDLNLGRETSRQALVELLIHEYGHILVEAHEAIVTQFEEEFWTARDVEQSEFLAEVSSASRKEILTINYYTENSDRFVTSYATTDPLEDFIESFVTFVVSPRRPSTTLRDKKINFFYEYPVFVDVRRRIDGAL